MKLRIILLCPVRAKDYKQINNLILKCHKPGGKYVSMAIPWSLQEKGIEEGIKNAKELLSIFDVRQQILDNGLEMRVKICRNILNALSSEYVDSNLQNHLLHQMNTNHFLNPPFFSHQHILIVTVNTICYIKHPSYPEPVHPREFPQISS